MAAIAQQIGTMRGVADTSSAVFSAELFGPHTFQNGRQVGAVMGVVPVPYRNDQRVPDQGIGGRSTMSVLSIHGGPGLSSSRDELGLCIVISVASAQWSSR